MSNPMQIGNSGNSRYRRRASKDFKMVPTMYFEAGLRWLPGGEAFTYVDNRDGVSNIWSQPLAGGRQSN